MSPLKKPWKGMATHVSGLGDKIHVITKILCEKGGCMNVSKGEIVDGLRELGVRQGDLETLLSKSLFSGSFTVSVENHLKNDPQFFFRGFD